MRKGTWPKALEAGAVQAKRLVEPFFMFLDRDVDKDARDPRRPLPNGTWAPPGPMIQVRDLDERLGP